MEMCVPFCRTRRARSSRLRRRRKRSEASAPNSQTSFYLPSFPSLSLAPLHPRTSLLLSAAGSCRFGRKVRWGEEGKELLCVVTPFRAARPPHQQPSSEQRTIRADYFPYFLSFCLYPHTPSLGSHRTSGRRQPSPFPRSALSFKSGQPPLARIATLPQSRRPLLLLRASSPSQQTLT